MRTRPFYASESFNFTQQTLDLSRGTLRLSLIHISIAVVREILGNGTLYGVSLFGANFTPAAVMIMAPGGFLTLGLIIALVQGLRRRAEGKERRKS